MHNFDGIFGEQHSTFRIWVDNLTFQRSPQLGKNDKVFVRA